MTDIPTLGPTLAEAGLAVAMPQAQMPQEQQMPVQPEQMGFAPRPVDILEGIDLADHVTVGVYGAEGSAKTMFGATAPKPLFLDTENSSTTLRDWPELIQRNDIKVARKIEWHHADTLLKRLGDPNDPWADRETVILDTLDSFQESAVKAVLASQQGDKYLAMQHHYKKANKMIREWLTDLRDLDRFHLLVLIHEKEVVIGEGAGAAMYVRPAVTPGVMSMLWNDFDVVGHMRILEKDWSKPFSNGLQVRSDDVIKAKCRLRYLHPAIRDPNFGHILEAFNRSRTLA